MKRTAINTRVGSVKGQSRRFGRRATTSGLPPGTDIAERARHVENVPQADIVQY